MSSSSDKPKVDGLIAGLVLETHSPRLFRVGFYASPLRPIEGGYFSGGRFLSNESLSYALRRSTSRIESATACTPNLAILGFLCRVAKNYYLLYHAVGPQL